MKKIMPSRKTGVVRIECQGAAELPLDKLVNLQGAMKRLSTAKYEMLRGEIKTRGFSFPVAIWRDGKRQARIVDGHQRVEALKRMQREGWTVPKIPIVVVQAKNENEAKRKLLSATSQYGEFDLAVLREFMAEMDLAVEEAGQFALPGIDLKNLMKIEGEILKHGDADVGKTYTEGIDAYENSSVRQIMLVFSPAEFEEAVAFLQQVKEEQELETNNDAVIWLLKSYAEARAKQKAHRHEGAQAQVGA